MFVVNQEEQKRLEKEQERIMHMVSGLESLSQETLPLTSF